MDVEAIKNRLNAAHKGPWRVAKAGDAVFSECLSTPDEPYFTYAEDDCIIGPSDEEVLGVSEWIRVKDADLEFMANARQDIEYLLEEIERMLAENSVLREELKDWWEEAHDEACTNMKDCASYGGNKECYRPLPEILNGKN